MTKRPKLFNKKQQQEWSEEYKYKHIHTGEYCKFESYVAEYLVIRWADAFKMDKPSYKFWTIGDKYHDVFLRNMKAAIGLKKKFDEKIILEAIQSEYFKNIYHVGVKCYGPRGWKYNSVALEAIKRYDREVKEAIKISQQKKEIDNKQVEQKIDENIRRTKSFANQTSIIKKLRNL